VRRYVLCGLVCWFGLTGVRAAGPKAILDLAPSLTELGEGWTTNLVVSLLDPLSSLPDKRGKPSSTRPSIPGLKRTGKPTTGMGWGRFHYGRGDLEVNGGGYFVSIQRWTNTNTLDRVWRQWQTSTNAEQQVRSRSAIGEDSYWTETDRFHSLTFRRAVFHVVVECGPKSDHSQLLHLAEVIDHKISPRPPSKPKPANGN
jgi:hypothetical protein